MQSFLLSLRAVTRSEELQFEFDIILASCKFYSISCQPVEQKLIYNSAFFTSIPIATALAFTEIPAQAHHYQIDIYGIYQRPAFFTLHLDRVSTAFFRDTQRAGVSRLTSETVRETGASIIIITSPIAFEGHSTITSNQKHLHMPVHPSRLSTLPAWLHHSIHKFTNPLHHAFQSSNSLGSDLTRDPWVEAPIPDPHIQVAELRR